MLNKLNSQYDYMLKNQHIKYLIHQNLILVKNNIL